MLSSLLQEEKELEKLKQELVLSNNFSLKILFHQFSNEENKKMTKFEFQNLLNALKFEKVFSKDFSNIFEFYSQGEESLGLEEFTKLLSPEQKEYRILMSCKIDKEVNNTKLKFEEVKEKKNLIELI